MFSRFLLKLREVGVSMAVGFLGGFDRGAPSGLGGDVCWRWNAV